MANMILDSVEKIRQAVRDQGVTGTGGDLRSVVISHLLQPLSSLSPRLIFEAEWDPSTAQSTARLRQAFKAIPPAQRLLALRGKSEEWI